jgi:hypothetical protein
MLDRVSTAQRYVHAETVVFCWIRGQIMVLWHVQPTVLMDLENRIELRKNTGTDSCCQLRLETGTM